jgi:tRNA(adenine34) deaminase
MTAADPLARLGPKTQAWLAELGVHSHAQLVELGAVEAFVQLKARGHTVARTLLWALHGCVLGCRGSELSRLARQRQRQRHPAFGFGPIQRRRRCRPRARRLP